MSCEANKMNPLLSGKAYRILVDELAKHLSAAKGLFSDQLQCMVPEKIREAGINFHTIKGGAGFFGFSDVAGKAGEIESLLIKSSAPLPERIERVRVLLVEFEALVGQMPAPVD